MVLGREASPQVEDGLAPSALEDVLQVDVTLVDALQEQGTSLEEPSQVDLEVASQAVPEQVASPWATLH